MEAELVVEVALDVVASCERAEAATDSREEPHGVWESGSEDGVDGSSEALPGGPLGRELTASVAGNAVVLGAAVVVGGSPVRGDPATVLEPMECGVERTLIDLEHVPRELLDPLRDAPAVHRLERDGFEDEEVEGPLEDVRGWEAHGISLLDIRQENGGVVVECQGEGGRQDGRRGKKAREQEGRHSSLAPAPLLLPRLSLAVRSSATGTDVRVDSRS